MTGCGRTRTTHWLLADSAFAAGQVRSGREVKKGRVLGRSATARPLRMQKVLLRLEHNTTAIAD